MSLILKYTRKDDAKWHLFAGAAKLGFLGLRQTMVDEAGRNGRIRKIVMWFLTRFYVRRIEGYSISYVFPLFLSG